MTRHPSIAQRCATFNLLMFLALTAVVTAIPYAAQAKLAPLDPANLPFLTGGDISLLTWEEEHGQVYKDNGKPADLLSTCKAHGWNCMRLRLWVHPTGQGIFVNDLSYTVALGKRIKDAGFYLILDIHYSDTWADPGKQFKPAAWANLPFDQLTAEVQSYTRDVITAMRKGGAMPDIVQVGNEITGGMLWPDGKNWGQGHDFTNLAALLKAGIAGLREGAGPLPPPLVMIHIDRGGDWKGTQWFFDNLKAQGVAYDIIGESYYPFFQGPMVQLQQTLQNAATTYHKPIVVAETGYPYKPMAAGMRNPNSKAFTYPFTPQGQHDFLQALVAMVHQTPENLGKGVIYWEPEWIPVKDAQGSWGGTTLFDDDGNALPGVDSLGQKPSP